MAILTWFGGKEKIKEKIISYFPKEFNNYFEPFSGSASIFFYLKRSGKLKGKEVLISDRNFELISVYHCLQDALRLNITLQLLEVHKRNHSKKYFNSLKKLTYSTLEENAARFIYFNRACFSGIYRECRYGGFNIAAKPGDISWLPDLDYMVAHSLLSGVKIKSIDYSLIYNYVKPGDLVYLDPPYQSFYENSSRTVYSMFDFSTKHQWQLKEFCDELSAKGVYLVQSNSPSDVIFEMYENRYCIDLFDVTYHSDGKYKYDTSELVITNFDENFNIIR